MGAGWSLGGDEWSLDGMGGALDLSAVVGRGVTGRQSGPVVKRKTMALGLETQLWCGPAV